MSRADEHLAQFKNQLVKAGQWIAIRRYSGAGLARTWADTPTRAYVLYDLDTQLVGTVVVVVVSEVLGLAQNPQTFQVNPFDKVGALDIQPRNNSDHGEVSPLVLGNGNTSRGISQNRFFDNLSGERSDSKKL